MWFDDFIRIRASSGKNKFNKAAIDWTSGYYIASNGSILDNDLFSYSDLIPILPNTQYTISGLYSAGNTRIHEYTSEGVWIKQGADSSEREPIITLITSATTSSLRISMGQNPMNEEPIQIELGPVATPYEPYTG